MVLVGGTGGALGKGALLNEKWGRGGRITYFCEITQDPQIFRKVEVIDL